jgi:aminopeptidase-like protein
MIGNRIHKLAKKLWPINRSITGSGVIETLNILKIVVPELKIKSFKSGSKVFDWKVPAEWEIKSAWVKDPTGKTIIDFSKNNLHLVGYSTPVNKTIKLEKLNKHLHSIKEQPNAIPYVTSYYEKNWGFCLKHSIRKRLKKGNYRVFIDSKFKKNGKLSYGEILIPGKSKKEIFLSTYICHPSMANNELSGPCVVIYLANWIKNLKNRRYSYRIVLIPETIGSIAYLSKNYKAMKKKITAGYNICCIGDERNYSYLPSRNSNTLSDFAAKYVLKRKVKKFKTYTWLDRGSDERQYCAPGIDLPIASVMRTKYLDYPEYHTSLDNLKKVVTPKGLNGGFNILKEMLIVLEQNIIPRYTILCEPQLSKRNLYSKISKKNLKNKNSYMILHLLSLSDGKTSLIEIAEKCSMPIWKINNIITKLLKHKLIEIKY